MKKLLAVFIFLLIGVGLTAGRASAQTAQFVYADGVGTPNAGTYTPGSSFTFAISLVFAPGGTVTNLEGFSYYFEQKTPASAPFPFAITNRDVNGSQFTDLQTPGLTYPQMLAPINTNDLGALLPGNTGDGAGTYLVSNLTVSISASAAAGTYVIDNATVGGKRSIITDDQGDTFVIPSVAYTITVVPEPSTWGLLCVGLGGLGLALRRRASVVRSRR